MGLHWHLIHTWRQCFIRLLQEFLLISIELQPDTESSYVLFSLPGMGFLHVDAYEAFLLPR